MPRFAAFVGLLLVLGGLASAHDVTAPAGIDLTRLPLGDGKLSHEPKAGMLWTCGFDSRGGGARVNGPWIKSDGTYDFTAKAVVSGAVTWPSHFVMSEADGMRVFTSNDLPNHPTGVFPVSPTDSAAYRSDPNPNRIAAHDIRLELPLAPTVAPQPGCAPGAVGILLTGVALFSAIDALGRDAVAHEVQDGCQGHPQNTGSYHYHSVTTCLDDKRFPDGHSMLVGYALDGFGIYGPYGEGGKPLTSADLDACHGHVHKILWDGKMVEMYHYHGTWDFPYTVGCMRGRFTMSRVAAVSGGDMPPAGPPGGMLRNGPRPNLQVAAARLGMSEDRLRAALGVPPPNLSAAAAQLGISLETLRTALDAAR